MIPYAAPRTLFSEVAPSAPDPHPKHPDRSPQFGAASGPVDIGGEQPEPAESAACPERPSHGPHSIGTGPSRLGRHRIIPAQRDRDVLCVDEHVKRMLQ
jgi:hypothetical protein